MKKLIFFLLLLSHFSYAQWIYNKKVDPIDGLTETVIASGRGGKFPYEKPNLVIRKINNEIAMYISDPILANRPNTKPLLHLGLRHQKNAH